MLGDGSRVRGFSKYFSVTIYPDNLKLRMHQLEYSKIIINVQDSYNYLINRKLKSYGKGKKRFQVNISKSRVVVFSCLYEI